jgi:hypothetical protein
LAEVVVEVAEMVPVVEVLSLMGEDESEELVMSANIRESVVVAADLFPDSLFMAPRMASTTPVMPMVQMMMAAHFRREMVLYQGASRGSIQMSSGMTGSLLPAVSGRRDERVSCSVVVPSPPKTTAATSVGAVWGVLAALEQITTSGNGFCKVSAYR